MQVGSVVGVFVLSVLVSVGNLDCMCLPFPLLTKASISLLKQENEFLQDVFGFTPKKKCLLDGEHRLSSGEKVCSLSVHATKWFSLAKSYTLVNYLIYGVMDTVLYVICHSYIAYGLMFWSFFRFTAGIFCFLFLFVCIVFFSFVYSTNGFLFFLQRMYRSPNSVLNKARTQLLNKQRMLSEVVVYSLLFYVPFLSTCIYCCMSPQSSLPGVFKPCEVWGV